MMNKAIFIIAAFMAMSSMLYCAVSMADTIHLKNGGKIDGTVIKDDGAAVTIDIGCGTVVQNKKDITRVDEDKSPRRIIRAPQPKKRIAEVFDFLAEGAKSVLRLDFLKKSK